jgi:acetyl esterase/lipase
MSWAELTQDQRDAAYDTGRAVPDYLQLRAAREAASAAYRSAQASACLDVPYGPRPRQKWDLYPGSDPRAPCLVFIHGGYWQMNSREPFACMAAGVASHGWSAALPSHTLAPEATLTEIVGEIDAAITWLSANGPDFGVAGPIILSGWSAGGHLTAMALDHPAVAAGVAISGIFELAPLRDTYLNQKLRLSDADIREGSPLRRPVVDKPLIVAYGTDELPALVADSRNFHAYRQAADAPGALLPITAANHFTVLDALTAPDGALTRAALALAASVPAGRDGMRHA